jgi:hypothetical protein
MQCWYIPAFFLTLTVGIYMTKTLDRVNKLYSRNLAEYQINIL